MAIFKCKHTGCVYEWTDEQTIEDMRAHDEYEEETEPVVPVKKPLPKTKKVKGELA
tara:strand:+ start:411 stop:578 length:168 start_codon:yes stop_codon:yes gene_type:complete